jgi:hypothetical protein
MAPAAADPCAPLPVVHLDDGDNWAACGPTMHRGDVLAAQPKLVTCRACRALPVTAALATEDDLLEMALWAIEDLQAKVGGDFSALSSLLTRLAKG